MCDVQESNTGNGAQQEYHVKPTMVETKLQFSQHLRDHSSTKRKENLTHSPTTIRVNKRWTISPVSGWNTEAHQQDS